MESRAGQWIMLDKSVRQFLKTWVGTLAIVFLAAMGALAIVVQMAPWRDTFDTVAWKDQATDARDRQEMADDLIARRLLDGLTREEVIGLLGEPSKTGHFSEWDLVYWLGPYGIDSGWLVIQFGKDGGVSDYRIVPD